MATTEDEDQGKSVGLSKERYDIITNKIAVALARHDAVVKGWTAKSARSQEPRKTQEQLEAEDAELFRPQPPRLGIGHPIPAHFLKTDAETGNKDLRAKFFPSKSLKASKARDAEEKAASAKRGMRDQSSGEEEGRSGLGRAKKQKTKVIPEAPKKVKEIPVAYSRDGKDDMRIDEEDMATVADLAAGENLESKHTNQESSKSENGQTAEGGTESQPTEKQKKKKKKKTSKSSNKVSEREPQGIPILPSRPVPSSPPKVDKVSNGSTKVEMATPDKMEVDNLAAGSDLEEVERLRRKELKKELKKQRKRERKEKRRSELLPASISTIV